MDQDSANKIGELIATSPSSLVETVISELRLKPDKVVAQKLKDEIYCFLYHLTDLTVFGVARDSFSRLSRDDLMDMIYPPAFFFYSAENNKSIDQIIEMMKQCQTKWKRYRELLGVTGLIYRFVTRDLCGIAGCDYATVEGMTLVAFFNSYSLEFMSRVQLIFFWSNRGKR